MYACVYVCMYICNNYIIYYSVSNDEINCSIKKIYNAYGYLIIMVHKKHFYQTIHWGMVKTIIHLWYDLVAHALLYYAMDK